MTTFNGSIRKPRRRREHAKDKIRYVEFYRSEDADARPVRGSVWSVAPGRQRLHVVPLEGDDRKIVTVRFIPPRWVVDTDPPDAVA